MFIRRCFVLSPFIMGTSKISRLYRNRLLHDSTVIGVNVGSNPTRRTIKGGIMNVLMSIQLIAAAYMLWIGTAMTTKNLRSSFVFKYVPLIIGIALVLSAFKVV